MLPTLLIAMDFTVLHLAVPSLTADLHPTSTQLLWIVDIYGFMIAGWLLTMGTLGDQIGRRKLLLTGTAAFGLISLLAAFSTSAEMLIVSRALLGVAGATLMPSTLSLILVLFPDSRQRTVALGVWASGFSVGSALGPLVGGWLLEHFWWGSVFLIGVPVSLLLLAVGPRVLPEYRNPEPGQLDLVSVVLSIAAVLLIIDGLKELTHYGFAQLPTLTIAAGLITGGVFLRRQRRIADPLLDLRLFASRAFSAALAANTLIFFVFAGITLFTAQYLQLVVGLSPFEAGLWTLPSGMAVIVGSNLAPRLVRRVPAVAVITGGFTIMAFGSGLLVFAGVDTREVVVTASVVIGIGLSMASTLITDMILATCLPERAGTAAGLSETAIEFGSALGVAILGSLGAAVYRGALGDSIPDGIPSDVARAARDTLGTALAAAGQRSDPLGDALVGAAREGFVDGLRLVGLVSSALMAGMSVVVAALFRRAGVSIEPDMVPSTEAADA
jgi:DHA2 family multidrug resistance protein-like MFS transporter